MRVKKIKFNWHQVGSLNESDGAGEDYSIYEVGRGGVLDIIENEPLNGLQQWNYVIKMEDGTQERVFNPNWVEYFKVEN